MPLAKTDLRPMLADAPVPTSAMAMSTCRLVIVPATIQDLPRLRHDRGGWRRRRRVDGGARPRALRANEFVIRGRRHRSVLHHVTSFGGYDPQTPPA